MKMSYRYQFVAVAKAKGVSSTRTIWYDVQNHMYYISGDSEVVLLDKERENMKMVFQTPLVKSEKKILGLMQLKQNPVMLQQSLVDNREVYYDNKLWRW